MPFFWTRSFNKSLHYTGNGRGYDRVHIDGNLAEMKFLAYYLKDEKVLAVAGMQRSPDIMVLNEAMRLSQMPKASEIESGAETVESIKTRVKKQRGGSKCKRANCCRK